MKNVIIPALLSLLLISPTFAQKKVKMKAGKVPIAKQAKDQPIQSLKLGSEIPNPDYLMQGLNTELVNLNQAKTEKGLLVMFSCNTCPYVIKAEKRTAEISAVAKELGIGMAIINSNEANRNDEDSYQAMKQYGLKVNYQIPYLRDEASMMADLFGATRTPEVFLFDGNGKLVYKGAMEDNPSVPERSTVFYLSDAMKALAADQPIKVAETKSIGCSIKRLSM